MPDRDFAVSLLQKWVRKLLATLGGELDEKTRVKLLEACGRTCAEHHGDLARAANLKGRFDNLKALLEAVNHEVEWCGAWRKEGDAIVSICERCGCPLVREGLIERSPMFCECSRGFVRALFETVLDRSVAVELRQAIGRGDPVCEFVVSVG